MASAISLDRPLAPPLPIHRFTVEQYHQLADMGILTPENRVELLQGWIVTKLNQRPIHGFIVGLLTEWFQQNLPNGWSVRCQLPITTEHSEPEPDVVIFKGAQADVRHQHPTGSHCRLVIEVADTSLERDRAKVSIYRDAGVQEYWIVNVTENRLERYVFPQSASGAEPEILPGDAKTTIRLGESEIAFSLAPLFE